MSHVVRARSALVASFIVAVTSCRTGNSHVEPGDAPTARSAALDVLRSIPGFAAHLGGRSPVAEAAGAFRLQPGALRATIADDGTERLAVEGAPDAWIELAPLGLLAKPASRHDAAIVREDVAVDTDLVQVVEHSRMEEFRVLRSARAPHAAAWRVRRGPSVARVEVRGGVVRVIDVSGRVMIRSEPAYAVDARRRTLPVDLSLDEDGEREILRARWPREDVAYPLAVDPAWVSAASGAVYRADATATLLPSGKLLVAGGRTDLGASLSTAQLYDPTTNNWTSTGSLSTPRYGHAAVVLPSGRVLVAGGSAAWLVGEIYDPASGSWSLTGGNNVWGNDYPLMARVGSKVLLVRPDSYRAEVYDPVANGWTETGPLFSHHLFGGLAAAGTSALVVGGRSEGGAKNKVAELYDPSTNAWTRVGDLSVARDNVEAITLDTGKVLLGGGYSTTGVSIAELFDFASKTWSPAAPTSEPFWSRPAMFPLPGGRAFAYSFATTEIYDAATNRWHRASPPPVVLQNMVAGPLGGGRAMLVSGYAEGGAVAAPQIFTLQPLGAACGAPGDCASLSCVDGVCCNTACAGACSACNLAGEVGTCSPVTGDPVGTRSCGSFACAAGSCKTACATDADCHSTAWCAAGACTPKKTLGGSCKASNQCSSGSCADGVCCNNSCAGQCAACNLAGSVGTCKATSGAPVGGRPACTGTGAGSTCGPACDGLDMTSCKHPSSSTPCSANKCESGKETHASTCDGAGSCKDTPKDCGVYACGTLTCKTSCTGAADCAAGYYCAGGACVPLLGLGTACTDSSSCGSGTFCADGVCCGVVSCEAGKTCAGPARKGTCTNVDGVACTADADCASGVCTDGVCCNSRCEGQCEACDVAGKAGTCSPVSGAPHGTRPKCGDGGGDVCKAMACNGAVDTTRCAAYASSSSVTCAAPTCTGASFVGASTCDGTGGCRAPAATSCVPYRCDVAGCRTACATNDECTDGFECRESRCVAKGTAVCSEDRTSSIPSGLDPVGCAPYLCGDEGTCLNACDTSAQCAPGNVCDATSRTCTPAAPFGGDDGGGCSTGRRTHDRSGGFLALFTALSLVVARRRWS